MHRRGQLGGAGLLGQGPSYNTPGGRTFQGSVGLLGAQPANPRIPPQRSHQGAADYRGGAREQHQLHQRGLLEQPDVYAHEGYAEQPVEEDYYSPGVAQEEYVEPQAEYYEDPVYEEQTGYEEAEVYAETQHFDYNHGQHLPARQKLQPQQPVVSRAGLIERPAGLRGQGDPYEIAEESVYPGQQRTGLTKDHYGGVDYQRPQRGTLNTHVEEQGFGERPSSRGNRRGTNVGRSPLIADIEPPVKPRALLDEASVEEIRNSHGFLELEHEQGGLLEPPSRTAGGYIGAQGAGRQVMRRGNQGLIEPHDGTGFRDPHMDQHGLAHSRGQQGLLDTPSYQSGLFASPEEQRALMEKAKGMMAAPRGNRGQMKNNQRGLLDTPRDQRGPKRESKSLLGSPVEARNEGRGFKERGGRGQQETGREPRAPGRQQERRQSQKGVPGAQQGGNRRAQQLSPGRRQSGNQPGLNRGNKNRQGGNASQDQMSHDLQLELMEKAGLQMKLLEEQQQMAQQEELERMLQQQQQQALLLQQQHLQQIQQQQLQEMQQQQQLYQQQQQAKLLLSRENAKNIPSIFDLPTKGILGKRPGGPAKSSANKRSRNGPEDRKRGNNLPKRDDSRRLLADRQRRQRERNREYKRNRDRRSPTNKKRDRKDSGPSRSSSRRSPSRKESRDVKDKGDAKNTSKNDTGKSDKAKPSAATAGTKATTNVTIELGNESDDKYDPANPTPDVILPVVGEKKPNVKTEVMTPQKVDGKKDEEPKVEIKDVKMEVNTEEIKEEKTEDNEKDGKQKEISLTVTVNKKGRSVSDGDKTGEVSPSKQKKIKCNVCAVECFDEESFSRHLNGKKHKEKMQFVMTSTSQQAQLIKTRMQAEEHLRQIESKKKPSTVESKTKSLETHCKTCDKMFTGAYKDHKESPGHKAREDRSKAGCKICKVTTFSTFMDFTKHLQSDWHRKNKRRLQVEEEDDDLGDLVTLDTVGFEEDSTTSGQSASVGKASVPKDTSNKNVKDTTSVTLDIASSKPPEEEIIPPRHDPTIAVGQRYVVPVSGFFCKLCSKFYINETSAKVNHCQSQNHYDKLKKALAAKSTTKAESKDNQTSNTVPTEKEAGGGVSETGTEKKDSVDEVSNGSEVKSKAASDGSSSDVITISSNEGTEEENMETDDNSQARKKDNGQNKEDDGEHPMADGEKKNENTDDVERDQEEHGEEEIAEEEEENVTLAAGKSPQAKPQRARRGGGVRGRRGRKI